MRGLQEGVADTSFLYGNFKYKTVTPSKMIEFKIHKLHAHLHTSETFQENWIRCQRGVVVIRFATDTQIDRWAHTHRGHSSCVVDKKGESKLPYLEAHCCVPMKRQTLSFWRRKQARLKISLNRGSYTSAHVLLNLLNKLGKRDKMRGLPSSLSLFRNKFNKSLAFYLFNPTPLIN